MVHTSRQLKALVRNLSDGDSTKAQILIRNYVMERFLERVSLSPYKENLIIKGGILMASLVGLQKRTTMDVDATIKHLPLNAEDARQIVREIGSVPVEDGMTFAVKSAAQIMDEADYPGIRVMVDSTLETMHTPLKIDFSTGDAITPGEVDYAFPLMFESRTIPLLAYPLETVVAEKLEGALTRGTLNSRMRDFYDMYMLQTLYAQQLDVTTLKRAIENTSRQRGTQGLHKDTAVILQEIAESQDMQGRWANYQRTFDYAANLTWDEVMRAVMVLANPL
jgi:predicted nucleotidyltransferase component of viral defense system